MEVLKYPDPRLLKPTKEVTDFGPELKTLLESMWETMVRERGIGMAANQVGLEQRMFVMSYRAQKLFLVNPKIIELGNNPSNISEGCLSAPGQTIKIYRPNLVKVTFQDETGAPFCAIFLDTHSVCVQHEVEHLDGKTFLQNKSIPKTIRKELAKKWGLPSHKIENGHRDGTKR